VPDACSPTVVRIAVRYDQGTRRTVPTMWVHAWGKPPRVSCMTGIGRGPWQSILITAEWRALPALHLSRRSALPRVKRAAKSARVSARKSLGYSTTSGENEPIVRVIEKLRQHLGAGVCLPPFLTANRLLMHPLRY
jgi:hypothetical protein